MEFKKDEMKNTFDQLPVPVTLKSYTKNIPHRFKDGQFEEGRMERVEREWDLFHKGRKNQWSTRKKIGVFFSAAAVAFLVFVGSGFVSPTMAKMIAKIPPLSELFNQYHADLSDSLTKELKKQGYPVKEVRELVDGIKGGVYISLDSSEEEIKTMKPAVEKLAFKILHGDQYKGTRTEDYFVRVRKYVPEPKEWLKEQENISRETDEIFKIAEPVLKAHNYNRSFGGGPDRVELEFPSKESPQKISEVKKAVEDALKSAGKSSVKVKYRTFNLAKREHYDRWSNAVSGIGTEFMTYKKYHVSGVGYKSINGEKMEIYIRMTLKSTDPKASELASDLNTMSEEFIHSDEIWRKVKDDQYEIIITSKDKKRMNK
ncbi:DUF4179 domain-containing protein [Bacillus sp. UNC438CL73TsuS30]|uniref:DUF4179 domain-containing protein n=1 Tax=Bacillus sp. UNC438CL73TsuS30 TaxID=1340434 RepID=UPI00047D4F62|nr:DUF4030 domain-containing protein [Bacillus sp. UNC438CL73TsuS30]